MVEAVDERIVESVGTGRPVNDCCKVLSERCDLLVVVVVSLIVVGVVSLA